MTRFFTPGSMPFGETKPRHFPAATLALATLLATACTPSSPQAPDPVPAVAPQRTSTGSPAFTPRLLQPWGSWGTLASSGGLPVLQICTRDNECEDGDILRVAINGTAVMQRELLNQPYCGNFRFNPGANVISVYAVNGTGYKGACSYADENTGEISVSNLRANGDVVTTARQVYSVRGGAGTESNIVVNLVR